MISATQIAIGVMQYRSLDSFWRLSEDYPYAVIKGEMLSLLAYNHVGVRRSGDIDVLTDRFTLSKSNSKD